MFIIHGFEGSPNGGWRPWLMGELEKHGIYACALAMPKPNEPQPEEWVNEIARHIDSSSEDEIYLVGHSLGGPTILRYLEENNGAVVRGAMLVSSPSQKNSNRKIDNFLDQPFDFKKIKTHCEQFAIIHGDNDPIVPLADAEFLSKQLDAPQTVVKNGGHLNGSAGWLTLPPCLETIVNMMRSRG